ncbi:MAG: hypothetical protein Q8S84_09690 [bacterium]|nr:hypothetical protein [bacterium]
MLPFDNLFCLISSQLDLVLDNELLSVHAGAVQYVVCHHVLPHHSVQSSPF